MTANTEILDWPGLRDLNGKGDYVWIEGRGWIYDPLPKDEPELPFEEPVQPNQKSKKPID